MWYHCAIMSASQRFAARFASHVAGLCAATDGVGCTTDRERYATLFLQHLATLYFLQTRGWLDGDVHYLPARLTLVAERCGPAQCADFVQLLLRQVWAAPAAAAPSALAPLLGRLPRLSGGMADLYALQQEYPQLQIDGATLLNICSDFAQYNWQLAPAPATSAASLTPDILAAVVTPQIERKSRGAYYTQADVSAYIAAATLVPALFDQVAARYPRAAGPSAVVWRLLQTQPASYVPAALWHGCDRPLPTAITAGYKDSSARYKWNAPADLALALPGETWRECIARRERVTSLLQHLRGGAVASIDAALTANLDLPLLACTAIAHAQTIEEAAAWYASLHDLRVCDPTCGAGDFLLAALGVLETLYQACLGRLAALDNAPLPDGAASVRRLIVTRNLFGIEIMPAAASAARLRLALAVAAVCSERDPPLLPDPGSHLLTGDLFAVTGNLTPAPADALLEPGGSFDAVIGNPPYLPLRQAHAADLTAYSTARCGNLFAPVVERGLALLRPYGRLGMIMPIAAVSTDAMQPLQALYAGRRQWHSHYAVRPGKLFPGVDMNLTISLIGPPATGRQVFSSGYRRWSGRQNGERALLFPTISYQALPAFAGHASPLPKLGSAIETAILTRMLSHGRKLRDYCQPGGTQIFYHSGGRYWRKALLQQLSSHYKPLAVQPDVAAVVFGLLNSQLFYWYWITHSNCMDLVAREVLELPVFSLECVDQTAFADLQVRLLEAYRRHSSTRSRRGARISRDEINIDVRQARPIIDAIDARLATAYGLDAAQLDFICNYDIKYRQ